MLHRTIFFLLFLFFFSISFSQEKQKNYDFQGYITDMQSVMFDSIDNVWFNDNLIHNRLNFKWYPSDNITLDIELRNRFIFGDQLKNGLIDKKNYRKDQGYIPFLTHNIAEGRSFLLNSSFDRLWLRYKFSDFEITLGRQRINWGQNFVWNPNDIFNVYSFFDFDYIERPGSDALRIQYFTGFTSEIESAIKIDSAKKITAAVMGKFSKGSYDFQVLGGILNSEEYSFGIGWTGNILNISFSGEATYLHPIDNFTDTTGVFIFASGLSYSFSSSFFIQFEALYNSYAKQINVNNFIDFYNGNLSVKKMAVSEFNIFSALTYSPHPLINLSLSAMYMPGIKGFYVGTSADFSLADDLKFSLIFQTFSGEFVMPASLQKKRQWFNLGFLRFKYSF
jgi:hypothetical protein